MIDAPLDLPSGATLKNRIVKSGLSEALGDFKNNPTKPPLPLTVNKYD